MLAAGFYHLALAIRWLSILAYRASENPDKALASIVGVVCVAVVVLFFVWPSNDGHQLNGRV